MLNIIKNAYTSGKPDVVLRFSKIKAEIARVLAHKNYIAGFKVTGNKQKPTLTIQLTDSSLKINHFTRISRPSVRIYRRSNQLPWPKTTLSTIIVSTSKGVMTSGEAHRKGLGGEIICEVS